MIIQIRGTSGSGKTTAMREVRKSLGDWVSVYQDGRKKPLYYIHGGGIAVLGHYESPCGGCDTIGSARQVFETIELVQEKGYNTVLCEGLLLSEDVKWAKQMDDLRIVFLSTPVETCLKRIRKRRQEAGNEKPLNPKNTENRVATIERARDRLKDSAVCLRASSKLAAKVVLAWLKGTE